MKQPPPRVGIYRACGIGDAVQLTPLFQQIRADCPDSEISFYTSSNVAPLLEHHPALNRLVAFEPSQTIGIASHLGNLPLWNRIRREGPWDLFLNFAPGYRNSLFFPIVRARRSTGFVTRKRAFPLYTHPIHAPAIAAPDAPHISTYYLNAWHHLTGHPDRGFGYAMEHLLGQAGTLPELPSDFICLAPGSGNFAGYIESKRWTHWPELAELLRAEGWRLVWLGGPEDAKKFSPPPQDINLLGRIGLVAAAKVLARSRGMIGNDSGMFHLAIGLGGRAAAFYGPTSSTHVGPFRTNFALVLKKELPCVPCLSSICSVPAASVPEGISRPFCMTLLHPADVMPSLRAFLGAPNLSATVL